MSGPFDDLPSENNLAAGPAGNTLTAIRQRVAGKTPDVFDAAAAAPRGDVYRAAAAPKRDVFDHAAASPFADMPSEKDAAPAPRPPGNALADARAKQALAQSQADAASMAQYNAQRKAGFGMEFISGGGPTGDASFKQSDTFAPGVSETPQSLLNQQLVTPEQFAQQQAETLSPVQRLSRGLGGAITRPIAGAVGLVDPEAARDLRLDETTSGTAGTVGGFIGNVVNLPYALTPAGQAISAASSAGNTRADIATRRGAGEQISGGEELANAAASGALDYAANRGTQAILGGGPGTAILPRLARAAGENVALSNASKVAQGEANRLTSGDQTEVAANTTGENVEAAALGLIGAGAHAVAEAHGNALERARTREALAQTDATPPHEPLDLSGLHEAASTTPTAAPVPPVDPGATSAQHGPFAGMPSEKAETPQAPNAAIEHEEAGEQAGSTSRLMNRRAGGIAVPDSVVATVEKARETMTDIDKAMGFGHTTTPDAAKTALNVRKSIGEATEAGHRFEAALAPERDKFENMSDVEKSRIHDEIEGGHAAGDPDHQAAFDLIREKNAENAARAKALGLNNLDEAGDNLARMFEFPDAKKGKGKSLAESNHPFYGRKFDSYADALAAAKAAGGKERYSNPLDAQIARQYTVEKNLTARENLRHEEDRGAAKWVPEGRPAPDTHDAPLKDRLIGSEDRELVLPKWMVGKYANMLAFDAKAYIEQQAAAAQGGKAAGKLLRPGDPVPDGYAKTGHQVPGQYHMDADHARMFNNFVEQGSGDPVVGLAKKVAQASVKFRYDLNASHVVNAAITGVVSHLGNAISRAAGGDLTGATKSLADAATGGFVKGRALRRGIEAGTAGDVGERVLSTGANLHLKSDVHGDNPLSTGRQFKAMHDAFARGNMVAGAWHAVKTALLGVTHNTVFHEILPNILAGHLATVAEGQARKGVSLEGGQAALTKHADVLAKAIGAHYDTPEFNRNITRQIVSTVMPAAGFLEGRLRVGGRAIADAAGLAKGGGLKSNPAALSLVATGLATTAALGAGLQFAMTGKWSDDPRDWFNPKTGEKDEKGREKTLALPGPFAWAARMTQHPGNETVASINPAIVGGYETYQNKDFYGNQVRPDDGSTAGNLARAAWHVGKGVLPGLATSAPDLASGKTTLTNAGLNLIGSRVSHPAPTDAEQVAYDALDKKAGAGGRNLEERARHDNMQKWVAAIAKGGGDAMQARRDMQADPTMNDSLRQSVRERAKEAKANPDNPLASIVHDSRFGVKDLSTIWAKARGNERPMIARTFREKAAKALASSRLSPEDRESWRQLLRDVRGGG